VIFTETELRGAFVLDVEPRADDRGFFARTWCARELAEHGLETRVAQCNVSFNPRAGTLRGLHYQRPPHEEVKLVRCTRGAVFDVIADLRPGSPTLGAWVGVELSEENRRALYVPRGFAHGYQTLTDGAEVHYQVSEFYAPGAEHGIRWNDPAVGVEWPLEPTAMSEKDAGWPDYVLQPAGEPAGRTA
jgi:dTDP-4-dehydrorhamnose 3,5-epimerase